MPCGHYNPFCPTPTDRANCVANKCDYPHLARMLMGCRMQPQSAAVPRAIVIQETPEQLHRRLAGFI